MNLIWKSYIFCKWMIFDSTYAFVWSTTLWYLTDCLTICFFFNWTYIIFQCILGYQKMVVSWQPNQGLCQDFYSLSFSHFTCSVTWELCGTLKRKLHFGKSSHLRYKGVWVKIKNYHVLWLIEIFSYSFFGFWEYNFLICDKLLSINHFQFIDK